MCAVYAVNIVLVSVSIGCANLFLFSFFLYFYFRPDRREVGFHKYIGKINFANTDPPRGRSANLVLPRISFVRYRLLRAARPVTELTRAERSAARFFFYTCICRGTGINRDSRPDSVFRRKLIQISKIRQHIVRISSDTELKRTDDREAVEKRSGDRYPKLFARK